MTDLEPLPLEHPLWTHPRVIVTPHTAGYFDDVEATRTQETAWRMLATLAERALDLRREALR